MNDMVNMLNLMNIYHDIGKCEAWITW